MPVPPRQRAASQPTGTHMLLGYDADVVNAAGDRSAVIDALKARGYREPQLVGRADVTRTRRSTLQTHQGDRLPLRGGAVCHTSRGASDASDASPPPSSFEVSSSPPSPLEKTFGGTIVASLARGSL